MTRFPSRRRSASTAIALLACSASLLDACAVKRGEQAAPGVLVPCPSSPNCVSSDAADAHFVAPYELSGDPAIVWQALVDEVKSEPRTQIVVAQTEYLHVESRSRIFGFVDDVEFQLRSGAHLIAVRSASRSGYSDLGVNRRRVEQIRAHLQARGLVK